MNRRSFHGISPGHLGWALLFLAFSNKGEAQGLLSNGDFELPQQDLGNRWRQPVGQYQHYETDPLYAAGGQHYNGICMYSTKPNEYFQVPLMGRMEAGRTYRLSMKVRVFADKSTNFQALDSLGVRFTEERVDVTVPFFCFGRPDLKVSLAGASVDNWVLVSGEYLADGNERYLMMGNFFERPEDRSEALEEQAIKSNSSKKKRKREMANAEFRQAVAQNIRDAMPKADSGKYFTTRWYFDDVCLAVVEEDGSSTCILDQLPEQEAIVVENIHFGTDKAELLATSFPELEKWVFKLEGSPDVNVLIIGHTDNVGNEEHNLSLSNARALAVKDFLIEHGIKRDRLSHVGRGSSEPIADNDSEEGRAINRRVEFLLLP